MNFVSRNVYTFSFSGFVPREHRADPGAPDSEAASDMAEYLSDTPPSRAVPTLDHRHMAARGGGGRITSPRGRWATKAPQGAKLA